MNDPLFWLYADNYRTYNIEVARKLGCLHSAIFLSEIASRHRYHRERKELYEDEKHGPGWFYYTSEDIEERTFLTRRQQDTAIAQLEGLGLIEKRVFGLPARRYFRLNPEKVHNFFFSNNHSSNPDTGKLKPREAKNTAQGMDKSKKHSSLAETYKLECTKTPNWHGGNVQTAHIYKEPKEEPKDNTPPNPLKREAATAAVCDLSSIPKPKRQEFGSHVKLHADEHKKLCDDYGPDRITRVIEEMNDYCACSRTKGYADYAAAIRSWLRRRDKDERERATNKKFAPNSNDHEAFLALQEAKKNAI